MPLIDTRQLTGALTMAATWGDVASMRTLLARGAAPAADLLLSMARSSVTMPDDLVSAAVTSGSNVNVSTGMSGSVLDLAKVHGDTPLVRALIKSGATGRWPPTAVAAPTPATTVRAAIERSLPLLDRADVAFIQKAGCISCHNNSLAALTREAVRAKSIRVNEPIASSQTQAMAAILTGNRERALQALGLPGRGDTVGYILLGMAAAHYPSNEITDAWARYMKNLQQARRTLARSGAAAADRIERHSGDGDSAQGDSTPTRPHPGATSIDARCNWPHTGSKPPRPSRPKNERF